MDMFVITGGVIGAIAVGVSVAAFVLRKQRQRRIEDDKVTAHNLRTYREEQDWYNIMHTPETVPRTPATIEMVMNSMFTATRAVRGMYDVELITPRGGRVILHPVDRHNHTEDPMIRVQHAFDKMKVWRDELKEDEMTGTVVFTTFVKDMK